MADNSADYLINSSNLVKILLALLFYPIMLNNTP